MTDTSHRAECCQRLMRAREASGVTVEQVSHLLGVSVGCYQELEMDCYVPDSMKRELFILVALDPWTYLTGDAAFFIGELQRPALNLNTHRRYVGPLIANVIEFTKQAK